MFILPLVAEKFKNEVSPICMLISDGHDSQVKVKPNFPKNSLVGTYDLLQSVKFKYTGS